MTLSFFAPGAGFRPAASVLTACCFVAVAAPAAALAPGNDNFADAWVLSGSDGTTTGTNAGATLEAGEPNTIYIDPDTSNDSPTLYPAYTSIWWTWTAPWDGQIYLTLGYDYDSGQRALLKVYTGASVNALTVMPGEGQATTSYFPVTEGVTYRIRVDGVNGSTGESELSWTGTPSTADLPIIAPIGDSSILEGIAYTGPTPALLQGGAPITWSLGAAPSGMTIDAGTGVVSWPSPVVGSSHEVIISAANATGFDTESWSLAVTPLCIYSISTESASFSGAGGVGWFNVTSPGNCEWTPASGSDWITITSGDGSGNGAVGYAVEANQGYGERSGSVVLMGHTHTVTQAGTAYLTGLRGLQQTAIHSQGEGYQEVVYNYSTFASFTAPYQNADGSVEYVLQAGQWMGIYHYDYATGRFTQASYKQKASL